MTQNFYFFRTVKIEGRPRFRPLPGQKDSMGNPVDESLNVQADSIMRGSYPIDTVFGSESLELRTHSATPFYSAGAIYSMGLSLGAYIVGSHVPPREMTDASNEYGKTRHEPQAPEANLFTETGAAATPGSLLSQIRSDKRYAVPTIDRDGFFIDSKDWMLLIRNIIGKVNIAITPDNSSTDARTVWVATKVFDDPDLPTGRKFDTFVGLAVHEGCHLLYTKFEEGRKCSNGIVHSLQNIIEDERIERECGESKPGLANFLKASKYYYFDKYREDMVRAGKLSGLDTFQRLMNIILAYVRYPKSLDLDDLQEFADVMLKVKEILLPYPTSTSASTDAAEKIYEVMKEFMQQQEQQNPQSSGGSQSGEQSGETQEGQAGETGHSKLCNQYLCCIYVWY